MTGYVSKVIDQVVAKDPGQKEYHQAKMGRPGKRKARQRSYRTGSKIAGRGRCIIQRRQLSRCAQHLHKTVDVS